MDQNSRPRKNSGFLLLKSYTNAASMLSFCSVIMLVIVSWCTCVESAISIPEDKKFPALIMFGDSILDPGNNNNLISPSKANFPPYGRDFKGGIPTGRFCNGKIYGDYIASELSIKEYLPAYKDPNVQPHDLTTGVSFASGGSGYDPLSSSIVAATTLTQQLDFFKEYKFKLNSLVGENQTNYIISRGLFGVSVGTNDILNSYYLTRLRQTQYDISGYTSLMASIAAKFYAELYRAGARRIMIFNPLPLGCLPSQRTYFGGPKRDCVEEINQATQMFNSKLMSVVESFNNKYTDVKAVVIDIFNPLMNIIKNPKENGFEVVDKGCCGTGTIEAVFLCNPAQTTCPDASKYVFWDSYHPTESAYRNAITINFSKVVHRFFR